MDRRQFIVSAMGASTVSIAGCLGGSDSDSDGPESVVEAFYKAESEEEQEGIIHSTSPYHPDADGQFQGSIVLSAESVDTEVIEEDISDDELQSRVQTHLGLAEGEFDILREETVTIVEADIELPDFFAEEGNGDDDWIQPVMTATEDGDWKVVIELTS